MAKKAKQRNHTGLTIPAFMSEEPVSPPSIVHKHHNDQGDTDRNTENATFTEKHQARSTCLFILIDE